MSRKHPFTSLFSPKMSQWCCLSASGLARAGRGRAWRPEIAAISPAVHGKWRDVADRCRGGHAVSRNVLCPITECARALLSAPRDYREFADSGACTTDRFCAIPLTGVADDDGAKTARISGRGRRKSPPGVETGYPPCLARPVWPPWCPARPGAARMAVSGSRRPGVLGWASMSGLCRERRCWRRSARGPRRGDR